ncbi:MAG: DUF2235 domain-containing protein [Pseudomonadota bacterium]
MSLIAGLRGFLARLGRAEQTPPRPARGPLDHVLIIDGTMSRLDPGSETNAGLVYKLLSEVDPAAGLSLRYEAGVQWHSWRHTLDIIEGRGINRQIRRMYGFLASRYRPGDRIFLMGYSRGAYAVRSLAGMIDRVGLLRSEHATERNIQIAYRHYQRSTCGAAHKAFVKRFCHPDAPIEMVGVWDTVKALGFRAPLVWRWSERAHMFHDHRLGRQIRNGFHALALDETREAFTPVLWETPEYHTGHLEQVWFKGSHGDVGGQLSGFQAARPLSNIPLVWMLNKAEALNLALPDGWRARFPTDASAPSCGSMRGWGKFFVLRSRRTVGRNPSEALHSTVRRAGQTRRWPLPALPFRRMSG